MPYIVRKSFVSEATLNLFTKYTFYDIISFMINMLSGDSVNDLPYFDHEINRDSGAANGDFMHIDGGGPIRTAIDKARIHGQVALLDAGCGTGYGLMDLKDQINFRAPIEEKLIDATGVSLTDFSDRFRGSWWEKERLSNGYIDLRLGNLATVPLEQEHYDVAYSYQVLLHNEQPLSIIKNVLSSLKAGGVYYFDALVGQDIENSELKETLDPSEWEIKTKSLTRQFMHKKDTRLMHKITRLPTN